MKRAIELLESRLFSQARRDSLQLGDRYVPAATVWKDSRDAIGGSLGYWCVIDAHMEVIISSGLSFVAAHGLAESLSLQDKVAQLAAEAMKAKL